MAELYLARTADLEAFERLVALKRILPQFAADDEFVRMFLDEARITAKLQHPNIAQVYDIGMDHDGLFFTMEFIPGENVQNILRKASMARTRVPLEHALAIAIRAASGLHAAHEQRGNDGERLGIVHRDVSPSNVIVSFDGCVKIIDFGVAKARGRRTKTRNGVIKGKISYMSPEQCRGEALDRRSDVFSLGILLYELTTTQRLFVGENEFAMIRQIVYRDAPRPSARVRGYPPDLEAIVMRALSRNIGRRYQSADELKQALLGFAHDHSLDVSTVSLSSYMREMFPQSFSAWERVNRGDLPMNALVDTARAERKGDAPPDSARKNPEECPPEPARAEPAAADISVEESPGPPVPEAQVLDTLMQSEGGEAERAAAGGPDERALSVEEEFAPARPAASLYPTARSRFPYRYLAMGAAVTLAAVGLLVWTAQRDGRVPAATSVGRVVPKTPANGKSSERAETAPAEPDPAGPARQAPAAAAVTREAPSPQEADESSQEVASPPEAEESPPEAEESLREAAQQQRERASAREEAARERASRKKSRRDKRRRARREERSRRSRRSSEDAHRDDKRRSSPRLLDIPAKPDKSRDKPRESARKDGWDPDAPLPPSSSL